MQEIRLVSLVSASWRRFGLQLDIKNNELTVLDTRLRDPDKCWIEVMDSWLTRGGTASYPASWEGLFKLLKDVRYERVAGDMKAAVQRHFGLS